MQASIVRPNCSTLPIVKIVRARKNNVALTDREDQLEDSNQDSANTKPGYRNKCDTPA